MGVHARVQRLLHVVGVGVGGQRHDGRGLRVGARQLADGARGLVTVHHGHHGVHEHGVEALRLAFGEQLHGLLAVLRLLEGRPALSEHLGQDDAVDLVVLGNQVAPALEHLGVGGALLIRVAPRASALGVLARSLFLAGVALGGLARARLRAFAFAQLELQLHGERGAVAFPAFHIDGAAHGIYQGLRDGHAQAGALDALHLPAFGTLERGEDVVDELGRHAHAVVTHDEVQAHEMRAGLLVLLHVQGHHAAVGRVLDRVRQQVQQDLAYAQLVGGEVAVLHVHRIEREQLPLRGGLRPHDGVHVAQQRIKVAAFLLQLDGAAFDFGHVEHVVDQAEQVLRRGLDGGQAFVGLVPVAGVVARNLRHAHDGVDGGADIVGHLRQERALRLVRLLGNGQRLL